MKIKQRMLSVCAVLMTSLIGYEFAGVTSVTSSSSSTTLEMNYVIDSVECRARSSCHEQPTDYDPDEEGVVLTAADRNCMCDDKCSLYGDCCHDNRAVGTKNATSARGVVHCLSLPEIDPTGPIYVVNRCPDVRGIDDVTRRRCEAESGSNVNLQLAKLPVVGVNTGILYRNAFCAACNSERDQRYVFWVAKLELCSRNFTSSHELRQNVSELLTFAVRAGCKAAFYPDKQSATRKQHFGSSLQISDSHQTPSSVVRRCRQHVTGRCDRNWLDRQTNRLCRDGPTSYVFAGRRTFRNRHCAVCNHVNETYLRCTPTENSVAQADRYNSGTNINEPFIIIDMNGRQAVLHSKSSNLDSEYEDEEDYEEDEEDEEEKVQPTFRFEACSSGQMYDPFSKKCIPVPSICRVGSSLVYGRCVPDDERYDDDDVTKVFARSAADELKHNDDDDDDDDEIDDAVVTTLRPDLQQSSRLPVVVECPLGGGLQSINETDYVRHPNGSVYVVSLRRLFDAELCHYGSIVNDDNNSKGSNKLPMYVCIDKPLTGSPSVTTASATATRQVPAPQPFRLPMFKFGSLERLASIIGTLIGAVAYLTVLLASCIFRHRGPGGCGSSSDTAARCVVCLMICLFVRHVCYLAIVTGDSLQLCLNSVIDPSPVASPTRKVCFYASAGLQYASLAAFFWLNVLTVEVYRRLSAKLAISPVHPSIDFIFYSLYAWTLPALVVGWSIAVEILGVDAWAPSFISEGTAEENAPQSSTDSAFSSLKRHSSECWVLGFIQLLLFVIPAALLTIVDIVLFVVAGCRKCLRNGSDDDDDDDEETDKSPTRKKLAAADEHLPHPWRRNAPDKQRNADYDEDAYDTDGGSTLTLRRAENLYVCSVQLTMLMSMTWTLCFMASTLPGAPHPLLWYLYVIFDVALALTASFAFLTTEYQIWRRMATRRSQWDLLLAADSPAHRLQRRATGPGDVIVVEGMTGWPTSTSQAVQSTDTSEPNLPLTAAATTSCEPADTATDRKDDDSLRLLMRETSI